MAQGMQCLHAISDYMRKVELLPPPYNACNVIITICTSCTVLSYTTRLSYWLLLYFSLQRNRAEEARGSLYTQDAGYDII